MPGKKIVRKVVRRKVPGSGAAAAAQQPPALAPQESSDDEGVEVGGAGSGDDAGLSARDMLEAELKKQDETRRLQLLAEDDEAADAADEEEGEEDDELVVDADGVIGKKRKRVWDDDDDEVGDAKARAVLGSGGAVSRKPDWAAVRFESDEESGGEDGAGSDADSDAISEEGDLGANILGDTKALVDRKKRLQPGTLDFQMLKDANAAEPSNAALSAVHFHPNGTILLTASPDFRLRLFETDGVSSTKLQTVKFHDLPPQNARFSHCGSKIIVTGKRKEYAVVDVTTSKVSLVHSLGRHERNLSVFAISPHAAHHNPLAFCSSTGSVHFVSPTTHQPLFALKGEGPANGVAFNSRDENQVFTIGGNKVYVWDVRTRRPLRIHADEGSLLTTSIDVSGDSGLYTVGSSNGVVNVYDIPSVWPGNPLEAAPVPKKAVMSLTTEVAFSQFNNTGDLLCIGSQKKKNAVRIVHTPSQTVYSNFPRLNQMLRKTTCCDFSPASGMLCIGMDIGAFREHIRTHTHTHTQVTTEAGPSLCASTITAAREDGRRSCVPVLPPHITIPFRYQLSHTRNHTPGPPTPRRGHTRQAAHQ